MTGGSPWRRLGIARTDDANAIRRAYAKKLKEIDPETDPQAFIALREARDIALARAAAPAEPAFADAEPAFAGGDLPEAPFAGTPEIDEPEPDSFAAIEAMLFDDDTPLDPERLEAMTAALLDDPAMARVDFAAEAELRLAWAAAATIPRSDAMLDPLVAHFGWDARAGDWDLDPNVELLVERRRALHFLEAVAQPSHPHHDAYVELCSQAGALGLAGWTKRGKVRRLLGEIRSSCPAAEQALEPYRVALWDQSLKGSIQRRLRTAAYACWVLFIIVRLVLSFRNGSP